MRLSKQEIRVLRETFLFHSMSARAYMSLTALELPGMERRSFSAGQAVCLPEGEEHQLAVVISGSLLADREPEFPNQRMGEGFVIGVLDLFSREPPSVPRMIAEMDCQLLLISASQLRELFERFPELMMRYINFLTRQVQMLKSEHQLAAAQSPEQRVLRFLAQNLDRGGEEELAALPCSLTALAARLHMSRATLYRTLERLEAMGAIQRDGKRFRILQTELLEEGKFV